MENLNKIDDNGFKTLFDRYYTGLVVYAMEFSLRKDEAEDIVQDIFVALWRKRESLYPDGIVTYLFHTTRNSCLNYLSHLKVRTNYQNKVLTEGKPLNALEPDRYVESDLQEYLEKNLAKLPAQRRKVFMMNYLEDKSVAEIAKELTISPKTVYAHLELARKFFRSHFSRDEFLILALTIGLQLLVSFNGVSVFSTSVNDLMKDIANA